MSGGDKDSVAFFAPQVTATAARITAVQHELAGLVDSVKGKALIAEIDTRRHAYTQARAALLDLPAIHCIQLPIRRASVQPAVCRTSRYCETAAH